VKREMERDPSLTEEEASRKVRSLSPFLGWVCCIAAVSGALSGGHRAPRNWSCSELDGEGDLLRRFWSDVAAVPTSVVWVTFNGKRFDAPYLLARSLRHGIAPTQRQLLDRYPYRLRPHADLAWVWPRQCSLDGLCDHLGVASSKGTMMGADVAGAVARGGIVEVAQYCEADTVATLECLQAMPCVLDL
jgi:3'-5' exonuclease